MSALSICIVLRAFVVVISMCLLYVSFGLRVSPSGLMGLRCLMLTLSGPVELLFLLCFIATWTCVVVSVMLVVCSLSVFLSMCLVCFVCFMFDCVDEFFVEYVCYLCG